MAANRFYVRIVRDDNSITYKGPLSDAQAGKEAAAWREEFPAYTVDILGVNTETRNMVRVWSRHIARGDRGRYYGPRDWIDEIYATRGETRPAHRS